MNKKIEQMVSSLVWTLYHSWKNINAVKATKIINNSEIVKFAEAGLIAAEYMKSLEKDGLEWSGLQNRLIEWVKKSDFDPPPKNRHKVKLLF